MKINTYNDIFMYIADLLKRVYSIERVQDEIENLRMNFIIACIKSKDEDLKYEGMKMLSKFF